MAAMSDTVANVADTVAAANVADSAADRELINMIQKISQTYYDFGKVSYPPLTTRSGREGRVVDFSEIPGNERWALFAERTIRTTLRFRRLQGIKKSERVVWQTILVTYMAMASIHLGITRFNKMLEEKAGKEVMAGFLPAIATYSEHITPIWEDDELAEVDADDF